MRLGTFWDSWRGKGCHIELLLDIARNYRTLFYRESRCKSLFCLKAFSPCKVAYAGSIPTPASSIFKELP